MIESGSHVPGVSVAAFGLPPGTALRYEQPAAELSGYLIDYNVLDSDGAVHHDVTQWMLPGWAAIRIVLAEQPIAITLGGRRYDPLPVAGLYGPTSRATQVTTSGGVTIGIGISPLGWSRLFHERADALRDRIVPLDTVMRPEIVAHLVARLRASDQGPAVKGILDDFFRMHFRPIHRDEPAIRALMALILDDGIDDLAEAGARIGILPHTLRRLSARYFGFAPKTLLVRTRFLRAILAMLVQWEAGDQVAVAGNYHDLPHFLRDAKRFLGMTPRQFMAKPMPYIHAVRRARAAVIGAATGALQRVD